MKSIQLVIHCWAVNMPCYAKMLTAQLSSLERWPPKCEVVVSICTGSEDALTIDVIDKFRSRGVPVGAVILARSELFRRAIGRNMVAKTSRAGIVWFADCDALFGSGCLDALAATSFTGLAFPRTVLFHPTHAAGDADIERIECGKLFVPDLPSFKPSRIKFASGGYLIVDGDSARRGFMDGSRWVKPVTGDALASGFQNPREDIRYRRAFHPSTPVELPNLYRFRHSLSAFQPAEARLASTQQ